MSDTHTRYENGEYKILNLEKANMDRALTCSDYQEDNRGSMIPHLFSLTFQPTRCSFNLVSINI